MDEMMAESDAKARERSAVDAEETGDSGILPLDESASYIVCDASSLYVFSEAALDVRAAFQEDKRGLLTFFFSRWR